MEALRPLKVVCSVVVTTGAAIEMVCAGKALSVRTERHGDDLHKISGVGAQVDCVRFHRTYRLGGCMSGCTPETQLKILHGNYTIR